MWIAAVPILYTVHCTPALSQKQNIVSTPSQPKRRTTVLLPDRTELRSVHACFAQTHQFQVKGKQGGVDRDIAGFKQSCHELEYPFAESNTIDEKSHQIKMGLYRPGDPSLLSVTENQ